MSNLYRPSLALLTDLYQLTMAYGYWKSGTDNKQTVFNLFFRRNPFGGCFTVFCGLSHVIDYLNDFRFDETDIAYLADLTGNDGEPLFEQAFLDYLGAMEFQCDVDAMQEGSVVFPHQPLIRMSGPIIQCQILETALLNMVNFQTLIATKAARVVHAAEGDPVLEFGLRRAQGIDGSLSASYAAWIGGCAATSNVLAGKIYGIPVKGTHAHSWIMSFDEEIAAFEAYARAMPNNCVFLVDTYDTLEGVRRAVQVGRSLAEKGHRMLGIRLDSGDLAALSIEARKIMDEAGFSDARIVASNDLDEHLIAQLKQDGAKICMWGVGTKLVTAFDQPALGGVYKLSAMRLPGAEWQPCIKLSEEKIKTSNPGVQQVRRFFRNGVPIGDVIYDQNQGIQSQPELIPLDGRNRFQIAGESTAEDLLQPVFRNGRETGHRVNPKAIRQRAVREAALFRKATRDSAYPTGLDTNLYNLREYLIRKARS